MPTLVPGNQVWIEDATGKKVPVEFIKPFEINFPRGHIPWTVEICASDTRFAELKNPCKFIVRTPGRDNLKLTEQVFANWFLVEEYAIANGYRQAVFADLKWRMRSEKLTMQMNIKSYGGEWRAASLENGVPYSCYSAFKAALLDLASKIKDVKIEFEEDPEARKVGNKIELPKNLGNRVAGGWFAADTSEFVPVLGESGRLDWVQTPEGKISIVERESEASAGLKDMLAFAGVIGKKNNKYQKPKKFVFQLQKRLCNRFEALTGTTVAASRTTPAITNVCPNYNPDSDAAASAEDIGWTDLVTYAAQKLNVTEQQLLERMLNKQLFDDSGLDGPTYLKYGVVESIVKAYYRRGWQVHNDEIRRYYADIKLALFEEDGTSKAGAVSCNFVRWNRAGRLEPGQNVMQTKWSENVPFTRISPFTATWEGGDREALVFMIKDPPTTNTVREHFLGWFDKDVGLQSIQEMVEGKGQIALQNNRQYQGYFELHVYWHAIWIGPEQLTPQLYEVEKQAFGDEGQVERVVIRVDDMTANYYAVYDSGDPKRIAFPGRLLNATAIDAHCEELLKSLKLTYQVERNGEAACDGIYALTKGYKTRGDIYQTRVLVGNEKTWDIQTNFTVMQQVRAKMGKLDLGDTPEKVL